MKHHKKGRSILCILLTVALVCAGSLGVFAGEPSGEAVVSEVELIEALTADAEAGAEYEGYIVKLDENAAAGDVNEKAMAKEADEVIADDIAVVEEPEDVLDFAEPEAVEYIEPNYVVTALGFPEDEPRDYFYTNGDQWGIKYVGAKSAWRSGYSGAGVNVAVIDTGIFYDHEDIDKSKILDAYDFINGDAVADDEHYHGTLVAGIIAAKTDNLYSGLQVARGVAGLAYDANLLIYKVLNGEGEGTSAGVVAALTRILNSNIRVDVVNLSLGSSASSYTENYIIQRLLAKGTIVVAAAGNNGADASASTRNSLSYPAAYSGVIGVGSIGSGGAVSSFSAKNKSVDVAAPGENIFGPYFKKSEPTRTDYYKGLPGTSFSSPIVAAAAAMAKQRDMGFTSDSFLAALKATVKDAGTTGYDTSYGNGVLSLPALTDYLSSTGAFDLSRDDGKPLVRGSGAGATGSDYYYDMAAHVLHINSSVKMTVKMADGVTSTGTDTIRVSSSGSGSLANLTLDGVNIDVSDVSNACAFSVGAGTLYLTLKGANTLKSSSASAGLQLTNGANLSISAAADGSLAAQGGGAGIGGGNATGSAGNITIKSGTVTATTSGTVGGAGIGGGHGSSAGNITITGGTVTATGGSGGGAGIGGGSGTAPANSVAITGGTVVATRGNASSMDIGQGAGTGDVVSGVTIDGGSVRAVSSAVSPSPKNSAGVPVAVNELDFDFPVPANTAVTAAKIDGVQALAATGAPNAKNGVYGIYGVKTLDKDGAGKVWFWLRADTSQSAEVALNVSGTFYGKRYPRTGGEEQKTLFSRLYVDFAMQGRGDAPQRQEVGYGGYASPPAAPSVSGYTFGGWYGDSGCTQAFSFDTPVTADMTLYAKWTGNPAPEENGTVDEEPVGEGPADEGPAGEEPVDEETPEESPELGTDDLGVHVRGGSTFIVSVSAIVEGSLLAAGVKGAYRGGVNLADYIYAKGYLVDALNRYPVGGMSVSENAAPLFISLPVPNVADGRKVLVLHQVNSSDPAGSGVKIEAIPAIVQNGYVTVVVDSFSVFLVYAMKDAPAQEDPAKENPPEIKAQSVEITGAPAQFAYRASGVGNELKLKASVGPANADDRTVWWSSSDPSVAVVDADGLVTFWGAEGDVEITAEAADGGVSSVRTIHVVKNVTAIRTPLRSVYIQKGRSLTLPVVLDDGTAPGAAVSSELVWRSSNPGALTVSADGTIRAAANVKKAKKIRMTVTAANGTSLTILATVMPKALKLKKVTAEFPKSLKVGATYPLKVNIGSATGVRVTFGSSNGSVIRVDKAGKLFALKKGKAMITVKAGKKSVKKTIIVK
jgi:uncharacterized repeat protein (TIGR02543 family)